MSESAASDRYLVPGLVRGLQILSQFNRREREITGAEFARRLSLPRASVFRMLYTLEANGFLERAADGVSYKLGLGVLRLGFELLASMELTEMGLPIIEALRDQTGYSAHIMVRDQTEVVCVAKAASSSATFHSIQVGARLPCHATVLGRLLLSDLDMAALRALYPKTPLPAYTDRTPTTLAQLRKLMDEARAQGYSISLGGYETSISTVAAPVFNDAHQVVATVSISVPASDIPKEKVPDLTRLVRESANLLSQRVSHLPQGNRGHNAQAV